MDAYGEGYEAFCTGLSGDNPWAEGLREHDEWRLGWEAAEKASQL